MSQVLDIDGKTVIDTRSRHLPRQPRMRKNIQLLFLGLSAEETAPLITLLRTSRISPRGKQVHTEKEFLEALSERSWDLILCTVDRTEFTSKQAVSHLKRLDKDIPIIQIIPSSDSQLLLQGLKNHFQAVVPLDEKELVIINIRRELDNLTTRRSLRKAEAALAEAEKHTLQLMESSKNAIACLSDGKITFINDSFLTQFGYSQKEKVINRPLSDFFTEEDRSEFTEQFNELKTDSSGEAILQLNAERSDQSQFTANIELSHTQLSGQPAIRALFRTEQTVQNLLLSEDLDLVSGLYNRDHLDKKLEQITQRALRGGNDCNLIYIELDRYDQIKSRMGHDGADQLIREVSTALSKSTNSAHLLTHIDEKSFVIIFQDSNIETANSFADTLCHRISKIRATVSGVEIQSTCTIGLTIINDTTPPPAELLNRAHGAISMFRETTPQGNGVQRHISQANLSESENSELSQIRQAIEENDFKLLFQPVVNLLADNTVEHHYEVLLRLSNNDQDLTPNEFMTAAGDHDTALKMDRWVVESSLRKLKPTLDKEHKNILFINISTRALGDMELLNWLAKVLRKNDIPAERLIFQISESDVAISPDQAKLFTETLHKMHCRVCIKHFGSSLNSDEILNQVNTDYVKLDGAYIQELGQNELQDEELFALVEKLRSMEKRTIAPLVENTKSMATLWKAGVNFVQGYYLQPPRDDMDYDFFAE